MPSAIEFNSASSIIRVASNKSSPKEDKVSELGSHVHSFANKPKLLAVAEYRVSEDCAPLFDGTSRRGDVLNPLLEQVGYPPEEADGGGNISVFVDLSCYVAPKALDRWVVGLFLSLASFRGDVGAVCQKESVPLLPLFELAADCVDAPLVVGTLFLGPRLELGHLLPLLDQLAVLKFELDMRREERTDPVVMRNA